MTASQLTIRFRFARLTDQHFYVSVLQGLSENQRMLDEKTPFLPPMGVTVAMSTGYF